MIMSRGSGNYGEHVTKSLQSCSRLLTTVQPFQQPAYGLLYYDISDFYFAFLKKAVEVLPSWIKERSVVVVSDVDKFREKNKSIQR